MSCTHYQREVCHFHRITNLTGWSETCDYLTLGAVIETNWNSFTIFSILKINMPYLNATFTFLHIEARDLLTPMAICYPNPN